MTLRLINLATPRITGLPLTDHTFLFCGAGEAGTGIGQMIVIALMKLGLTNEEAHKRCWFVDSRYISRKRENKID